MLVVITTSTAFRCVLIQYATPGESKARSVGKSATDPIHFSPCRVARADSRPRLAEPLDGALKSDGGILACPGLPNGALHSCQSIPHASGTPLRCTSIASAKGLQFCGVCCW